MLKDASPTTLSGIEKLDRTPVAGVTVKGALIEADK